MSDDFPDTLTQTIGVLLRRETEARVLAPVIDALADTFGRDAVVAVVRDAIVRLAREQGSSLAAEYGDGADAFLETLQFWTKGGALEIEVLEHSATRLDFDVTRCRYAEMYRALGIADLGKVLSCNRDYAMVEGFNADAALTRDETILTGSPCCTFRYRFPDPGKKP
ncbi:MAG: L-2-amino-thiazoline-4-carboxylic acid hydrolase [Rhodobacteraceae bacterium]|nr:L-2-amino-thiazoline-4-carboxylic acid hydrolase [Paracoccaceae bacterium]